jgi:hypothetical protein
VADGVDAAVDPVQPTTLQPVTDGSPAHSNPSQLLSCYHAVLTLRQFGHQPVGASNAQLCPTIGLKCAFVRHARILAVGQLPVTPWT